MLFVTVQEVRAKYERVETPMSSLLAPVEPAWLLPLRLLMKESRAREVCDSGVLMFYCQHSGEAVDWLDSLGAYTGDER